jgi:NhaP-type Na+/H+ or K+/H+ antiporter
VVIKDIFYILNIGLIVSDGEVLELESIEIVAFAIIMSSVECVVAKSIVDIHYRPKLHNILFGEELMNDVTVYSLFVALLSITKEGEE